MHFTLIISQQVSQCDYWLYSQQYNKSNSCISQINYDGQQHLSKQLFLSESSQNSCYISGLNFYNNQFINTYIFIDQTLDLTLQKYQGCQSINIDFIQGDKAQLNNITIQGQLNLIYNNNSQIQIIDYNLTECQNENISSNINITVNNQSIEEYSDNITLTSNFHIENIISTITRDINIWQWGDNIQMNRTQIILADTNIDEDQLQFESNITYSKARLLSLYSQAMLFSEDDESYFNAIKYIKLINNQDNISIISCQINQTYYQIGDQYQCQENVCIQNNTFNQLGICQQNCNSNVFQYIQDNLCSDQCNWYRGYYLNENNQCIRCEQYLHNDTQECNENQCYQEEQYYIDYSNCSYLINSVLREYCQTKSYQCLTSCGNISNHINQCALTNYNQCNQFELNFLGQDERCYSQLQFGLYNWTNRLLYNSSCSSPLFDMQCQNSGYPIYMTYLTNNQEYYSIICFENELYINQTQNCTLKEQCYSCNTIPGLFKCNYCPEGYVVNQATFLCDVCLYQSEEGLCIEQDQCTHQINGNDDICYLTCFDKCPEDYKYYLQNDQKCYEECPESSKYFEEINEEILCKSFCNSYLVSQQNEFQCVQTCDFYVKELDLFTFQCLDECDLLKTYTNIGSQQYKLCTEQCREIFISEDRYCVQECDESQPYVQEIEIQEKSYYQCQSEVCEKYQLETNISNVNVIECVENCQYYLNQTHCTEQCDYLLQDNNTCVESCQQYFVDEYQNNICHQQCNQYVQMINDNQYQCIQNCNYYINQTIINDQQSQLCQEQCEEFIQNQNYCVIYCQFYNYQTKICQENCQIITNIEQIQYNCVPNCLDYTSIQDNEYYCDETCQYIQYQDYLLNASMCVECQEQFYGDCILQTQNTTCIGQNQCHPNCSSSIILQNDYGYYCVDDCQEYTKFYEIIQLENHQNYKRCVYNCTDTQQNKLQQEDQCVSSCLINFVQVDEQCYLNNCSKFIQIQNYQQECTNSCYQYNMMFNQTTKVCTSGCLNVKLINNEYQCLDQCFVVIQTVDLFDQFVNVCEIECQNLVENGTCKDECDFYQTYLIYQYNNLICSTVCSNYVINIEQYKQTICLQQCNYQNYTLIQNDYCVDECSKSYNQVQNQCLYNQLWMYLSISLPIFIVIIIVIIVIYTVILKKRKKQFEKEKEILEQEKEDAQQPFKIREAQIEIAYQNSDSKPIYI